MTRDTYTHFGPPREAPPSLGRLSSNQNSAGMKKRTHLLPRRARVFSLLARGSQQGGVGALYRGRSPSAMASRRPMHGMPAVYGQLFEQEAARQRIADDARKARARSSSLMDEMTALFGDDAEAAASAEAAAAYTDQNYAKFLAARERFLADRAAREGS